MSFAALSKQKEPAFGVATATFKSSGLRIGEPGDAFETEADRIADRIVAGEAPTPSWSISKMSIDPPLQRACACGGSGECEDCNKKAPQAHNDATLLPHEPTSTAPGSVEQVLASSGRPLDSALRTEMGQHFGYDFSSVRVHSGAAADQSAREVNAEAYTVGHHIVFGSSQFAPATRDGRRLIAHELTHVLQQRLGATAIQRSPAMDKKWNLDENAARYRGDVVARRIRKHGKLSKEVRAIISRDLVYFEGAAKEAYLDKVGPALRSVTEIEMAAAKMRYAPPFHYFTDDQLFRDFRIRESKREAKEEQELEIQKSKEYFWLEEKTKHWRRDYWEFASDLLLSVIKDSVVADPRAVSDKIRQPILDRYRAWLIAVDKERLKSCDPDRGAIAKLHVALANDDPCKSWFENDHSYGPSQLLDLKLHLKIFREWDARPAAKVWGDVEQLRLRTDPHELEMAGMAADLTNVFVGVAGGLGDRPVSGLPGADVDPLPSANAESNVLPGSGPEPSPPPAPKFSGPTGVVPADPDTTPVPPTPQTATLREVKLDLTYGPPIRAKTPPKPAIDTMAAAEDGLRATGTDPTMSSNGPGSKPPKKNAPVAVGPPAKPVTQRDTNASQPYRPSRRQSPNERAAGTSASENHTAAASAGRRSAEQYRANLIDRFPELGRSNLKLSTRNLSIPGQWEESVFTGGSRFSWSIENNGSQIDDISQEGFIVESKMVGIMEGREIPPDSEPDVVNQMGMDSDPRSYPIFPEKQQKQLIKSIRAAQENELPGVVWFTNSPELAAEWTRYRDHVLTKREQRLFIIELIDRF